MRNKKVNLGMAIATLGVFLVLITFLLENNTLTGILSIFLILLGFIIMLPKD